MGSQILGGTGSIIFGLIGNNQIDTASSGGSDTGTLTIGSNITIEGNNGQIGFDGGGAETPLVIQGTVDANTNGGLIYVSGVSWSNSGTLEASGGGQLQLAGTWTDNGVVSADSTSQVNLQGTFSVGTSASFTGTGTVAVSGILDNSGTTLTLDDSLLTFEMSGGEIDGGDIVTTNGAALFGTFGTLAGVTLDGTLDMATYSSVLAVTGGLTLSNGSILIGSGAGSTTGDLTFEGAQSFGGTGTIVFGGGNPYNDRLDTASSGGDSGTLTIGSGITIEGQSGFIGLDGGGAGTPLILEGTVDGDVSGGQLHVLGVNWSNLGTITATSGGGVTTEGTWTDHGVVSADSTSTVYLAGTFSVGTSSSFAGTGSVYITGTLDNTGETLTLNDRELSFGLAGGTIDGGTVETTGGATLFATLGGGTLDGVIIDGTLDMSGGGDILSVTNGLTLNGKLYLGPADPTEPWSVLDFQGTSNPRGHWLDRPGQRYRTRSTPPRVAVIRALSRSDPTSRLAGVRFTSGTTAVAPRPRSFSRAPSTRTRARASFRSTQQAGRTQVRSKPPAAEQSVLKRPRRIFLRGH